MGHPPTTVGPVRGVVLVSVILLATAAPAAGQTTLGLRAGVGSAWLVVPGSVHFGPCLPDEHCPPAAPEAVRGLAFGADLDVPVSDSGGVFGLRIGAAYTEKGGAVSRHASGEPGAGALSTSYLQFSVLLRARAFRTSDRVPSLVCMVGPWVGSQLSCEKEGDLAANCEVTDAGVAVGAGVEIPLPGGSRASVGLEGMYYRGLREHSQWLETTRFAAMQVGFAYKVG